MSEYQPPQTLWEVSENLHFDEPLSPNDSRYVETDKARGDFKFNALFKQLGVDPHTLEFKVAHNRLYVLFCGHRGCGKSTELRRICNRLNDPQRFFVVFVDTVRQLDTNNLQYADMLFALAHVLFEELEKAGVSIQPIFLEPLARWFEEKIASKVEIKDLASEIKAGASVDVGLPFFSKLFASMTNALKVSSTYKDELRQVLKNHFTEFATAFNQLIAEAETQLQAANKGRKLLFIVDGTDRLSENDSQRFFIKDVHQLQLIDGLFIYCAPIRMVYEENQINQAFRVAVKLPMIKLCERDGVKLEAGYDAMRDMLYRRAAPHLFDSEATAKYLIEHSGGHPRDLLRLLSLAFGFAEGDQFDRVSAEKAVKQLAMDYRRILKTEDYRLLYGIDQLSPGQPIPNSEQAQLLLYNLALLEYNDYWWKSHPVIRTLPEYQAVGQP
ncbi:MAG: AAA family ATPase [Gammaproteobacteria bacterium]|nr:AAA family ATPase [Gammaproteobacteria bacterium]